MENRRTSSDDAKEDLSDIKAFVNEGGKVVPESPKADRELRKGAPLGVDPRDLTTAKQFDEARANSHRR